MEIFRKRFAAGCEVVVTSKGSEIEVVVKNPRPRPRPEWLREWQERGVGERWVKISDDDLCSSLLAMVGSAPGRGKSYYAGLSLSAGGCGGSQERKLRLIASMLESGLLLERPVPVKRGRACTGLFLPE